MNLNKLSKITDSAEDNSEQKRLASICNKLFKDIPHTSMKQTDEGEIKLSVDKTKDGWKDSVDKIEDILIQPELESEAYNLQYDVDSEAPTWDYYITFVS